MLNVKIFLYSIIYWSEDYLQEIQTIPRLRKWEMSREAENVHNHCNTHLLNI